MERNRVKRLLREAFAHENGRLPAGTDAVVIARHGARELAEREGLAGIQRALAELIDKVPGVEARSADGGAGRVSSRVAPGVRGPDPGLPAPHLAVARAALQVLPFVF